MKHKHAEMIKAKADNMELELFFKDSCDSWRPCTISYLIGNDPYDYFLCLPQHKEACLHWLNGGDVIVRDYPDDEIERVLLASGYSNWHEASVFMCERTEIRIKPKKEKVWVAYHKDGFVFNEVGGSESDIKDRVQSNEMSDFNEKCWQYKAIEVEV